MNETFLEAMARKGWVKAPDGSWHKPARGNLGAVGLPVQKPDRVEGAQGVQLAPNRIPKRIRQSSKPIMNKLEMAFWKERLEFRYPKAKAQAIKFKLANGIAYKPDFVDLSVQPVKAWEVKGPHSFRGGFENLKVAASLYSEVRWLLVWKENGQWQEQEVLP